MREAGETSGLSTWNRNGGRELENPWCGLSVFEGLSYGHGTKFNKGQIGINYKVVDVMQEEIPTKLCKHIMELLEAQTFIVMKVRSPQTFGCGTED